MEAAHGAGATYADARLTRTVQHWYSFGEAMQQETEKIGIGVRALVNGYWGFAACPSGTPVEVEQLAQQAVAQARINARGTPSTADLGLGPAPTGTWATPVRIDPFTVPIEEKVTFMRYWDMCARKFGVSVDPVQSYIAFARQDRVVATSDGARFTQTLYESGGKIVVQRNSNETGVAIRGIETAGRGWELFLDAKIPEQMQTMSAEIDAVLALEQTTKGVTVGRYTLVCDGATMAALLGATLGAATQLDRALGYEANAEGTSFLNDPLAMLGTFEVASPLVTLTANRSAPAQLATLKWDDEGVIPQETTLVKHGVLTDFQTTREQAVWIAPYYTKVGRPVRSNGYAASENALTITMQHMPNLALAPNLSSVRLEDLVADVQDGILIERGTVFQVDSQARSGLLLANTSQDSRSRFREIKNGRLGRVVGGGAVLFDTLDFWRHIIAVGGPTTQAVVSTSQYPWGGRLGALLPGLMVPVKGEPPQATSHSTQAVAATITNQPVINPARKA